MEAGREPRRFWIEGPDGTRRFVTGHPAIGPRPGLRWRYSIVTASRFMVTARVPTVTRALSPLKLTATARAMRA